MTRRYSWPEGHWDWPIKVTHKHGLRCGDMVFIGGQVDLDSKGNVLHPGDLRAQTDAAIRHIGTILSDLGARLHHAVKLQAFYVNDGSVDESSLLTQIARAFDGSPGLAINMVPLPYLAYAGLSVEIEAIAMVDATGATLGRRIAEVNEFAPLPAPLVHGVRCAEMIFLSGQSPRDRNGNLLHPGDIVAQSRRAMDQVGSILASFGAGFDDVVKLNRWYSGQGTRDDWEPAALAVADRFKEPGPAATGIPLPRHARPDELIKIDIVAMLGEDGAHLERQHVWPRGHWDWPVHLPYKHGVKCGNMIFIGGQVPLDGKGQVINAGQAAAQTRTSLEYISKVLSGFGLGMDSVVKVLTLYSGSGKHDELHTNLAIRSAAFNEPGPATTGIPLPCLAYEQMTIEIEIVAMSN